MITSELNADHNQISGYIQCLSWLLAQIIDTIPQNTFTFVIRAGMLIELQS